VPLDEGLCGFSIYLKALEGDSGAPKGVCFTEALQIMIGLSISTIEVNR